MEAYRIRITHGADRTKVLYDSGKQPETGTSIVWSIPLRNDAGRVILPDDSTRWLNVQVWDTVDREATPGDPTWTQTWTQFTVDDDLATTPVATLAVTQVGDTPAVQVVWTRAAAADSWELLKDGKVVETFENEDLVIAGTSFTATFPDTESWVPHTYNVKAVVNGKRSTKGPTRTFTTQVEGVWLRRTNGDMVQLRGTGIDEWVQMDRRITYKPVNRAIDVDIITQLEGITGPFKGTISESPTQDLDAALAILATIKDNPSDAVNLIAADLRIVVRLRHLTVLPSSSFMEGSRQHRVEFEFFQVGDIGYGVD